MGSLLINLYGYANAFGRISKDIDHRISVIYPTGTAALHRQQRRYLSLAHYALSLYLPHQQAHAMSDQPAETEGFVLNQTMIRIKDPVRSLDFYQQVLGMALYQRVDFAEMSFSLYFLGYSQTTRSGLTGRPGSAVGIYFPAKRTTGTDPQLGDENDDSFEGYHDGNTDPRGFGHIGITVPDVDAACERFEQLGVEFVKRPHDGSMKGLAFIKDPDGYWIEILNAASITALIGEHGNSSH